MNKKSEENGYYDILKLCDNAAVVVGCILLLCLGLYGSKGASFNEGTSNTTKTVLEGKKSVDKTNSIIFRDTIVDKTKQKVR